jgi:hypothetical protein
VHGGIFNPEVGMKWALIVVGVILALAGTVWILQGTNVLTQGSMAGHSRWTLIGSLVDAVGVALIVLGATRRPKAVP